MKKGGRYKTSGLTEDSYEPGSRGRVLQNKRGIISKRAMDEMEAREQLRALNEFLEMYDRDHRFTAGDICRMHAAWLGNIYEWAGKYRQVNISKGDFTFAMARQVPMLMEKFEQGPLRDFTPCLFTDRKEIIHAVAAVQAGMDYNYAPMESIFRTVLARSLRQG
jgi:cell filamentation protein